MKLILQDSEIEEKLAFPVRKELGEYNINIIYSEPTIAIIMGAPQCKAEA